MQLLDAGGLKIRGTGALRRRRPKRCLAADVALGFALASASVAALAAAGSAAGASSPVPTAEEARRANDLAQAAYYEKQSKPSDDARTPWWASLVVGAGLTLGGSVATLLFTNRVAARKALEDQSRLYRRQKLQVGLAVRALIEALVRFELEKAPHNIPFLSRDLLLSQSDQPPRFDRQADYYLKYDLVSTVYRLCALLGWMELYRIDPEFMSGVPEERARLESAFSAVRTWLSDDSASIAAQGAIPLGPSTNDGAVLADDQRAIGEKMLTAPDAKTPRAIVGYAFFCESLFRFSGRSRPAQDPSEGPHGDLPQDHWIWNATSFIVGLGDGDGDDLRVVRLRGVLSTLREVLPTLLPTELQNGLAEPT